MMLLCCWLALVALIPVTSSLNPGVKVKLTEKGIEYGRQLGMASIQQKLEAIKVPDISGKEKVQYSISNIKIVNVGLPKSAVDLVPGTGVRLSVANAFISLNGNWRAKYKFIKLKGSFDLNVNGLTITTSIAIKSDETGRPAVSSVNCVTTVGDLSVKFHGRTRWLNILRKIVNKFLRKTLEKEICPLVADAVSDLNPHLKTLNVVARVDEFAEIEYSMVSSPTVSKSSIDLSLKGEFYNIGKHQEPPFSPTAFSLPPQVDKMLYIGVSSFTINSAAFVYDQAGALSLNIPDDKIKKLFPDVTMMLVKIMKTPIITFEPNKVTVQTAVTVTAFSQPNTPPIVLNLETSVSARMCVSGMNLAATVTINKIDLTLGSGDRSDFQVKFRDSIVRQLLNENVIPKLNVELEKGFPLPTLGKMKLVNTEVQVLKDFMLIGTDVQFVG